MSLSIGDELTQTWQNCQMPNWDGYDALPVQEATLQNARVFIQALSADALPNSVGAEPDGHLTFDWYQHPRWTLSVSISPEGTLYYAGLFGDFDPRGATSFVGDVPPQILDLIATAQSFPMIQHSTRQHDWRKH